MHCLFHPVSGEGCGIVAAESLACGVPVVVPEYGGASEFVAPNGGVTVVGDRWDYGGIFCTRMAAAVTQIRERWEEFAKGAREQAIKCVSLEKMMDNYLDFMRLPLHFDKKI